MTFIVSLSMAYIMGPSSHRKPESDKNLGHWRIYY